jgi:hydroxyacylglutathione hydrolase
MDIVPIPLLRDNYAYLLIDRTDATCAVVDPSQGPPVAAAVAQRGLRLTHILATHHHPDHTEGIAHLASAGVEVIASQAECHRIAGVTQAVSDAQSVRLLGLRLDCLLVPGHTLGAVAFYLPAAAALFTGDTLFLAGCGRLFEGDAQMMHASLQKLSALPDATHIYCGHEYTEKNIRFAQALQPDSELLRARLAQVQALRAQGLPTVPGNLAQERATNPFLRASDPQLMQRMGTTTAVETFAALRRQRDTY